MSDVRALRQKRAFRVRKKLKAGSNLLRLHVFRSSRHIAAQVIDDQKGVVVTALSTQMKEVKDALGEIYSGNKKAAEKLGTLLGEKMKEKSIESVSFDRGPYRYHGRLKALAEAVKNSGIQL